MILWLDWALLQLAVGSASVCTQLGGLGFPLHVSFTSMVDSGFQEGKLQCTSICQAFACISFADVSLSKMGHMAKLMVNVGRVYTSAQAPKGMIHWGPLLF